MTELQRQQAIKDGALFPYTRDLKLYKCPTVERKVMDYYNQTSPPVRTYSICDAMNCKDWPAMGATVIKLRMKIKDPAFRGVFLDDGGTCPSALGGWTVYANEWQWWDPPPVMRTITNGKIPGPLTLASAFPQRPSRVPRPTTKTSGGRP
jgi:hypothetical protein